MKKISDFTEKLLLDPDAKEITRLFLERFNTEALPQLHGNIYNRWVFTHHVEHKDIEFGKHYLESHPESPVVLKAIADFLLVHLVASLSSAYKQEDYERAQLIYSILPKKIQDRIEGNIYYNAKKSGLTEPILLDDPEFGKHHIHNCFATKYVSPDVVEAFHTTPIKPQLFPAITPLPANYDPLPANYDPHTEENYDPHTEELSFYLQLTPDFYQRVWKVATEFSSEEYEPWKNDLQKDPNFGEKIFNQYPEMDIVLVAAVEEAMWQTIKLIPEAIFKGDFERAKLAYSIFGLFPVFGLVDREWQFASSLIEEKIWEVWSKEMGQKTADLEFGKHYLEKYFEEKKDDPIINAAFELFFKESGLNPEPNLSRYYNKDVKGLFYEIKNPETKAVYGYILGTIHMAPIEFNKIRYLVMEKFFACNVVSPEFDLVTSDNYERGKEKYKDLKHKTKVGFLDLELLFAAHSNNKKVVSLETLDTQRALANTLAEKSKDLAVIFKSDQDTLSDIEKAQKAFHLTMCTIWASGNEAQMTEFLNAVTAQAALHDEKMLKFWQVSKQRNLQMADKIHSMLQDPHLLPFFMPGASHLLDDPIAGDGIISLLREKGWSINQI